MKRIYKFSLPDIQDITYQAVPDGARFLTVQVQNGAICIWAIVDEDAPPRYVQFRIVGTGMSCDASPDEYIGTVQMHPFVWHVFARLPSEHPASQQQK